MNEPGGKTGIRHVLVQPTVPDSIQLRIASEKTTRIDKITDYCSDWFSPILVKETRQSLKSRQFFWTFFLLLTAVAVWTLIGLTINDASIEYGNAGASLLSGYWTVLGFPLLIVVPFGAYRSLAREYDDGTIQLIAVTTMKAWQIIAGKLGSSMLQMLIYVSVLAPCIAFTYLLKGLSIPQIGIGLAFCVSGCFGMSCVALFLAGATRSKFYNAGASILLILIQFIVYWLWCLGAYGLAFGELDFLIQPEGQFLTLGLIAAILSTGLLMFAAATVLISFDSDNRSTLVRIAMLIQQTLFVGWAISAMCFSVVPELATILAAITAHYWLIMGCALIGEDSHLSPRVRRSVPQTMLTRSMFSFFLPGSGRGLIFSTLNIWICGLAFLALVTVGPDWLPKLAHDQLEFWRGGNRLPIGVGQMHKPAGGVVSVCTYSSCVLALTYLIFSWLRCHWPEKVNSLTSMALGAVIVMAFTGFSLLFHYNILTSNNWGNHTTDQFFNGYWTSFEIANSGFVDVDPVGAMVVLIIMSVICCIALVLAAGELLQTRLATPDRVEQEIEESRKHEPPAPGESIEEIFAVARHELDD